MKKHFDEIVIHRTLSRSLSLMYDKHKWLKLCNSFSSVTTTYNIVQFIRSAPTLSSYTLYKMSKSSLTIAQPYNLAAKVSQLKTLT